MLPPAHPLPDTDLDTDLDHLSRFDFDDARTAWVALPVALALSLLARLAWLPDSLLWYFFRIPVHEFGHACAAWLGGRLAVPLGAIIPMAGMTVYFSFERSPLVFLAVFAGLGWLLRLALCRRARFLGALSAVLILLQIDLTWLQPAQRVQMLFTIGGLDGELVLGTLLVLAYFYRQPVYRWDFFRFVALLVGTCTFAPAFLLWRRISTGDAGLPLGSWLGSRGDGSGDLDRLMAVYGWSASGLVAHFNRLGLACLVVILGHYLFFGVRACTKRPDDAAWTR